MIQVIHTPYGEPIGQIISEIPNKKAFFTKPLRELEESQRILVSYNSRPLSAPVECKKVTPDACVHPGSVVDSVTVKYYKPIKSPKQTKRPDSQPLKTNIPKFSNEKNNSKTVKAAKPAKELQPKVNPRLKVEAKRQILEKKEAQIKVQKGSDNQKTVKATSQPIISSENTKPSNEKLKLILKESVSKLRERKQKEQEHEQDLEEKQRLKEQEIRDISEETKERLAYSKKVPFKPKLAWGADQRKFEEQDQEFRENAKLENEKKREAREKVRSEGRARIGLKDLFDAKPELEESNYYIEIRTKSKETEEKTKKEVKEPNPEIQAFMLEQKKLRKQKQLEEQRKKEEENQIRLAKLKELDEISRSRLSASKKSDVESNLERRMRVVAKTKKAVKRIRNQSQESGEFYFEENRNLSPKLLNLNYKNRERLSSAEELEAYRGQEMFADQREISFEKPEKDTSNEKHSEENYSDNQSYQSFEERNEKISQNVKQITNFAISHEFEPRKEDLPGNNESVRPSYQAYVVNPTAIDNLEGMKKDLEIFKSEHISIYQDSNNSADKSSRKERLRSQLANLQTRLGKIVSQEKEKQVKDINPIEDDLDIKFTNLPGILNIKQGYAEAVKYDELSEFRAAKKIQALVRGFNARKEFEKIKLGIPTSKQMKNDIHSLLNKYYPEAYISEDTIYSSYLPESMSYPATSINPTLSSHLKSVMIPKEEPIRIAEEPKRLKLQNYIKDEFAEPDAYNLVNILARELYIEKSEVSIEDEEVYDEEVYSEEFESVSQYSESKSNLISEDISEPARSSRIKFSDDYKLSSSKRLITESIYESIKESSSDISESFKFPSGKGLVSSLKNSIPESMTNSKPQSSRRAISESLGESSRNRFSSSIPEEFDSKRSHSSDISEDIYESKKTLIEHITEEISDSNETPYKSKIKQSGSDYYSEDFESLSSNHETLPKRFETPLQETYEDDFESVGESAAKLDFKHKVEAIPAAGKFSAKQLQDQLITQIETLDRAKEREIQAETMLKSHKEFLEDQKKEGMVQIMRAQEMYIQELKKSKEEDHNRFLQLAQFIANQQKESFSDLAAVIRQALITAPRPRSSRRSEYSEVDFVEERKSPVKNEDYIASEYSEDFESMEESQSSKFGFNPKKPAIKETERPILDYSRNIQEQREEAERSRFSSSSSPVLTRSVSPQIKTQSKDFYKLKSSDELRGSSSSIAEDIDVTASYRSSAVIEELGALKQLTSHSHETHIQTKSIESFIEASASVANKDESIDESLAQYSEDFDSLSASKSIKGTSRLDEYSSDFDSASQSIHPGLSSKVFGESIKEESPEQSVSDKGKEDSILESFEDYEEDFESESSSVLRSSRDINIESRSSLTVEDIVDDKRSFTDHNSDYTESAEIKQPAIDESQEEMPEEIQSATEEVFEASKYEEDVVSFTDQEIQASQITDELFEMILEDAIGLVGHQRIDVDEIVDELFERLLEESTENLQNGTQQSSESSVPAVKTDTNTILTDTFKILNAAVSRNFTLNPITRDSAEVLSLLRSNTLDQSLSTLDRLLPFDLYLELESINQGEDDSKLQAEQIHRKMIFDVVNESLNRLRPGAKVMLPWSNVARIGKSIPLNELRPQIEDMIASWSEIKHGSKDSIISEKKSEISQCSKLLNSVVLEEAQGWVYYDTEESRLKIDLESALFDKLVQETADILYSL